MGTNGEQAEQNSAHAPVHSVPSPSNLVRSSHLTRDINSTDIKDLTTQITPVDIPTGTPSRPTYQDVQVVGEVAGETCIASCTSPRDAPSLPPFAGEIGHVPVSEFATSLQAEDGSSRHTEQGDQNSAQPIALDACSSPSQLESMLQAALDKYKQRTKKDLTKEPFIAELENCKTTGDVMNILQKPINEFIDCQEKGKAKGVLTRTLNQMVDVLLALHLNETLGEGIGIVSRRLKPSSFPLYGTYVLKIRSGNREKPSSALLSFCLRYVFPSLPLAEMNSSTSDNSLRQ